MFFRYMCASQSLSAGSPGCAEETGRARPMIKEELSSGLAGLVAASFPTGSWPGKGDDRSAGDLHEIIKTPAPFLGLVITLRAAGGMRGPLLVKAVREYQISPPNCRGSRTNGRGASGGL